jgi:deoxyribose-phosphate aldolase
VRPTDVRLAAKELEDSRCTVASVVGFPHGANRPEVKAQEAALAISDGARELDMVMNIGRFLSGDYAHVSRDIEVVVRTARPNGVLVKVILETPYLKLDEVVEGCRISQTAGAAFVKTSTGFAGGGATHEAVEVMLKTVGDTMGVKASGGIRTWAAAVAFLKQGCKRLGIGQTEAVLDGAPVDEESAY